MLTQTPAADEEADPDPAPGAVGRGQEELAIMTDEVRTTDRATDMVTAAARHRLDEVGIPSLARMSGLMGASVFLVLLVAGLVAWWAGRAVGWVGEMETFVAESLGVGSFSFPATSMLMAWAALAAVVAAVAALSVALMGLAYNRMAGVVGGVELALTPLPGPTAPAQAPGSVGDQPTEAASG